MDVLVSGSAVPDQTSANLVAETATPPQNIEKTATPARSVAQEEKKWNWAEATPKEKAELVAVITGAVFGAVALVLSILGLTYANSAADRAEYYTAVSTRINTCMTIFEYNKSQAAASQAVANQDKNHPDELPMVVVDGSPAPQSSPLERATAALTMGRQLDLCFANYSDFKGIKDCVKRASTLTTMTVIDETLDNSESYVNLKVGKRNPAC